MIAYRNKFIKKIQDDFPKKRVIVIGDLIVDRYVTGDVKRVSPEAPVLILDYKKEELKVGGAANVAVNLKTLGCSDVTLIGIANNDKTGIWLKSFLSNFKINTIIMSEKNRPTTLKTRYSTMNQQLLRIDKEVTYPIDKETEKIILKFVRDKITEFDALIISDYQKGIFNNISFIAKIINICNTNKVPILIDSKSQILKYFKNADVIKPNNHEVENATGIKIVDNNSLNMAGIKYLNLSKAKALILTKGKDGISVFLNNKERKDLISKAHQVYDVTGAGDTVVCTITLGYVSGLSIYESVQLANLAASVVISKIGTSTVTNEELIKRIINDDFDN